MSHKPDYYDIGELRLFPAEPYLTVRATGAEIAPSPKHRSFLLALVRRYPEAVSYRELWSEVWRTGQPMTEDDRAKIQTTKGQLNAWLKSNKIESLLIASRPGEGYRLATEVVPGWFEDKPEEDESKVEAKAFDNKPELSQTEEPTGERPDNAVIDDWKELAFSNPIFLAAAALVYGILFQIAAFMEIAYDFDIYGERAVFGGLILMLVNIAAVFAAAGLMSYRLFYGKAGFLWAASILLAAGVLSVVIAYWFIPVQSVTMAKIQTQPALIAYGKNALLYFFPLGAMSILLPLYTVNAKRLLEERIINNLPFDFIFIKPRSLIIGCLLLIVFSFLTTNYLLDNLNSEGRHYPLYTALIFLRMFFCFGLAAGSSAWYYAKIENSNAVESSTFFDDRYGSADDG